MKIAFFVIVAAFAIAVATGGCDIEVYTVSGPPQGGTAYVVEPQAAPRTAKRWTDRVNAECTRRDRHLEVLARPTTLTETARHAERVLAVHRRYMRRVAALRRSGGDSPEASALTRVDVLQEKALVKIVRATRSRDLSRASEEAVSLRVLAGQANPELMRLGLHACLLRPSAMPV